MTERGVDAIAEIAARYPRTAAAFSALPGGAAALAHLRYLDASFLRSRVPTTLPEEAGLAPLEASFDVVILGGGLSLFYAAALSRAGLSVAVIDRRRIGHGHREWNISRPELAPLTASGLFTEDEVERLVRMQYRDGYCRFAGGGTYRVRGVLDCVIDSEPLLSTLRERAVAARARLYERHAIAGYRIEDGGVTVAIAPLDEAGRPGALRRLRGRLLIDALGAGSPHARFDLACPTVGGILDGLELGPGPLEMDPEAGEILVTTEGVEAGEQHIWEGFPAPASDEASGEPTRRMTVYLFYYRRCNELRPDALLRLYERFFETLPRYKRGALRMVRPTYGYIPAYTRLGPMPTAPRERVLLVGDAASRHSPLTFCGFGSMVRSFDGVSRGVLRCLETDRLGRADLEAVWQGQSIDPPLLQVEGGLTLMMAPPPEGALEDPDGINQLLDAAFASLSALGEEAYARFLKDDADGPTFVRFMLGAAERYPAVYRKVFRHMSLAESTKWLLRLARLFRETRSKTGFGR